jgi:hypothetical protein
MTSFPRYAIYFAAGSDSALSRFGAELLGYDVYTGNELPFPADASHLAPDWRDITADPRKYGFHGTLKAPMALAPGRTEAELLAACVAFAGEARSIPSAASSRSFRPSRSMRSKSSPPIASARSMAFAPP